MDQEATIDAEIGGIDIGLLRTDPEEFHKRFMLPASVVSANALSSILNKKGATQ